jgi:X-X-X-Leu-X-X-Gly heptad repeat protein
LRDALATLRDALATLHGGLATLRDGLATLRDGLAALRDGLATLHVSSAAWLGCFATLDDVSAALRDGFGSRVDGFTPCAVGSATLLRALVARVDGGSACLAVSPPCGRGERAPSNRVMAELVVVDDDADVADSLADILRDEGHVVRIAHDGKQGLALLSERLPDAVLLDVEMPVLTGPQMAIRMFLDDCGEEEIPVVLLSGVRDLVAIAARVNTPYFLSKPFAVDEMLRLLGRALLERVPPHPQLD